MATQQDVIDVARNFLRDFPRFYQVERSVVSTKRTYPLGYPNTTSTGIYVATVSGGTPTQLVLNTDYTLRERDGIIRLDASVDLGSVDTLIVEGDYYEWLLPEDLTFYSQHAIDLTLSTLPDITIENASKAVIDVIGMSAIVHSLWGLLTEFSRDVDVIASESVHIPASQRFRMVQSLLSQWEEEYKKHAQALNIGIDRIEVFNLRRRSRTTERLVPTYKERELGDFGPLERIWNPIDDGVLGVDEKTDESDLSEEFLVDGEPPEGVTSASYFPGYNTNYQ